MHTLYIKDKYYKRIVLLGKDPKEFVNEAIREKLESEEIKEIIGV